MEPWDRVFWVPFAALAAFPLYRWFKFRGLRARSAPRTRTG